MKQEKLQKHYNQGKDNPMYGVHRSGIKATGYIDGRTLKKYSCIDCGKKLSSYQAKRCMKCHHLLCPPPHKKGNKSSHWKGGKIKNTTGYTLIKKPKHPFCNNRGYVREHRLIVEKKIGRFLHRWEVIHHINTIRGDNGPENLMAFKNDIIHKKFESGSTIDKKDIIFDGSKK